MRKAILTILTILTMTVTVNALSLEWEYDEKTGILSYYYDIMENKFDKSELDRYIEYDLKSDDSLVELIREIIESRLGPVKEGEKLYVRWCSKLRDFWLNINGEVYDFQPMKQYVDRSIYYSSDNHVYAVVKPLSEDLEYNIYYFRNGSRAINYLNKVIDPEFGGLGTDTDSEGIVRHWYFDKEEE